MFSLYFSLSLSLFLFFFTNICYVCTCMCSCVCIWFALKYIINIFYQKTLKSLAVTNKISRVYAERSSDVVPIRAIEVSDGIRSTARREGSSNNSFLSIISAERSTAWEINEKKTRPRKGSRCGRFRAVGEEENRTRKNNKLSTLRLSPSEKERDKESEREKKRERERDYRLEFCTWRVPGDDGAATVPLFAPIR